MKKTPKRLSEWLDAAIIHLLKKQEKLIKKLPKPEYRNIKIDEKIPVKSIMGKNRGV